MSSSQILVFAGHRQHHARHFRQALLTTLKRPLGGLQIEVFPAWGEALIQRFAHLVLPRPVHLLKSSETLYLLRQFYVQQGQNYFAEPPQSKSFFWHLLRRHRRCAENLLWGQELEQRSQQLEFSPQAVEANRFLTDFSQWLREQTPALLDILAQMQLLLELAQESEVQEAFSVYTHWLIDDLDESRPVEQELYRLLAQEAVEQVYTGNLYGGSERLLGADPSYLQRRAQTAGAEAKLQRIELPRQAPHFALAEKITAFLTQATALPEPLPVYDVQRSQHPTQMYEAMAKEVLELQGQGVPLQEIICLSWALDEIACRHLKAHFQQLGIPVRFLRGQETLQRHPLVNTLLSLVRLVCWESFRQDERIPKLTGFDMVQIFRLCGGMDAFALARPRFELQDRLEAWGQFMREQASRSPALAHLQETVSRLRETYPSSGLENLYHLAQELWQELLLPQVSLEDDVEGLVAVRQLFELLERHVYVQLAIGAPKADQELMLQLLRQEIMEEAELSGQEAQGCLRIMTLYRLCELRAESDYQLWFDLSSPAWNRPVNHPLDNALLLSPSWPLERPWSLEAEEHFIAERLNILLRKGIQYCRKRPSFYACLFDARAQQQNFERLNEMLIYADIAPGLTGNSGDFLVR